MNIIEVIPISRGIGTDSLSYFTTKSVPQGALVDVPLRSKIVQGIVIGVRKVEDIKSEIKNAPYALRKVERLNAIELIPKAFMKTAEAAALYYATSLGSVLDALIPDYLLKNASKLEIAPIKKETETKTESPNTPSSIHEVYAVQGDDEERYSTWKSLIRQEFARKSSIILVTPTIEDAKRAFSLIEKGIEGYAFLLHGDLPKKNLISTWNTIVREPHPVVIVMTGGFLAIDRPDVRVMIVEKENARGYKIHRRPFLDVRHIAELIAEHRGIKLFLGDILLRAETLSRESEGDIIQAAPFKFRSLSTAQDKLIDMRIYKNTKGSFKILSDEVENLITRTKDASEHMMIFAARRGVAGATVCGDCQNIVTCNTCGAPVVTHKATARNGCAVEKNFFLCHHCGERRSTEEYCKICASWKLGTVGIGIDLVEQKIRDKFPDISIFRIDADATPSDKLAQAALLKFRAKPGSILLGTEMMLSYVHEKVENSAVISIDSMLGLPDFRIQEKILYTLIRMRARTAKELIVQTRKPDERLFDYALKGNLSDFYRLTLDERKRYNYPPFSTLIKITVEGKRDEIISEMTTIQSLLEPHTVDVFPAFTQTPTGNQVLHALMRLPRTEWPQSTIIEKLRSLPPSVTVKVDPDSLL
ncbi:MAG: primosomal protein [Candidatus Parcubacteria bacterium]|jgi:primosomal protein N'